MSDLRFEKRRADAELTLSTGTRVKGVFFLADSSARHSGPERIADLLNSEPGFFPFEVPAVGAARAVLFNRAHVVCVALPSNVIEAELEPGYEVAPKQRVSILLSTGTRVAGTVSVSLPPGHRRLSDYAQSGETFRYIETSDHTVIVNFGHIVELLETVE